MLSSDAAKEKGRDSALLRSTDASIHKANLTEKLLIPALVKLAFVPGGGIWMNTERPNGMMQTMR